MKIIGTSNFDDERVSDILICENVSEFYAKKIVAALNVKEDQDYFYKFVKDDHKLYEFQP